MLLDSSWFTRKTCEWIASPFDEGKLANHLTCQISDLESQLSIQLADNSQMKSELRTLSSRIDKLGQVSLNYEVCFHS